MVEAWLTKAISGDFAGIQSCTVLSYNGNGTPISKKQWLRTGDDDRFHISYIAQL